MAIDGDIQRQENINAIREQQNIVFWENIQDIITLLEPLMKAIGVVEHDDSNLSDVIHEIIHSKRFIESFSTPFIDSLKKEVCDLVY